MSEARTRGPHAMKLRATSESVSLWNSLVKSDALRAGEGDGEGDAFSMPPTGLVALTFGTAGLRAKEGRGWNRMNAVTVALTSQGIADYMAEEGEIGQGEHAPSVCIGFDGREGSLQFATAAALSFASSGLKVYIFDALVPTPLLAFATRELRCRAGVMVTASHNPKEYNGYKVYWNNGCQIIPPMDKGISGEIARQTSLRTSPEAWTADQLKANPMVSELSAERETTKYIEGVLSAFDFDRAGHDGQVEVVYTPLHGVGSTFVSRMFDRCGLRPFQKVDSQDEPDKDFPTVSFPNPEEGAGVWSEAFKVADEMGLDVCIANDPDADRLCCAERSASGWRVFSGNDLGIMLGDWIFTKWKKRGSAKKPAMLTTTVSARVLQNMCEQEGIRFEETLTGFKWLGNKALEMESEGYDVLFAYEEAIGFMIGGTGVVDKDGVAAAAVFMDMLNHVYLQQKTTLEKHLEGLFEKYGKREYRQGYFLTNDGGADEVMSALRETSISEIGGVSVESTNLSANMITFRFGQNGFCTIRASGTEPKVKYYIDIADGAGDINDVEDAVRAFF